MSRFNDYMSSAITPQMTLLEKFNALLKYLEINDKQEPLYYHLINIKNGQSVVGAITFYDTNPNFYTIQDILKSEFSLNKLYVKCNGCTCILNTFAGSGYTFQYMSSGTGQFTTFTITSGMTIGTQKVYRFGEEK